MTSTLAKRHAEIGLDCRHSVRALGLVMPPTALLETRLIAKPDACAGFTANRLVTTSIATLMATGAYAQRVLQILELVFFLKELV